jgi:long-chain acyl-CoA synthetase
MNKLTKHASKIPTVRENPGFSTLPRMTESSVNKYAGNLAYLIPRDNTVYEITYAEVFQYITKLAAHLKELGLGKGDHIAVLGENKPEWGISFFALSWIGAVAIPLDSKAHVNDLKFVLSFSSAKAVIVSNSFLPAINSMADEIDEICSNYASGSAMEEIEPDDLLEIIFTSGSTGDPKGVMLSHGNIMSNVSDIYTIMDYTDKDRTFSILPIHHAYECTGGLITPFSFGMSVFYARSLKPKELLNDLKTAKPTIWLNAPTILEKLYLRIEKEISAQKGVIGLLAKALPNRVLGKKIRQNLGLENTRLIISAGAALPDWVSEGFKKYGIDVIQAYGLTEASPLITANPPREPKFQSIGMVIPSNEVIIRDIDDEGNGEICARGPNIMKGYYKNKNATDETITEDGWLLTGDIGHFDEDGHLYITGRKKFVIVTKAGKNVHPEELEEKLTKSVYIEEALVFSPDDSEIQALLYHNTEEVRHKLQSTGDEDTPENAWELLKTEVRSINLCLEHYKKIRCFALRLEEFPKTTTNKIKRHEFKGLSLTPEIKIL